MAIEIFCFNCNKLYGMASDNTVSKPDKRTGIATITTKCPICKEKNIGAARDFDTITNKERSEAATKPGSFDAIDAIIDKKIRRK